MFGIFGNIVSAFSEILLENNGDIFFQIGIIIIIATILAFIAKFIKQPLIPAYVLAGLIIGPVLKLITNTETIITLSEIGIAFLLFIVGLEINLKKLKDVGLVSSIGGLTQMLAIFTASFIIAMFLGFYSKEAVYIGLIIAFSSTMVVVKLLSDKKEIDTLHGRIVLGILIMQDILAILVLSALTTLGDFSLLQLFLSLFKGAIVFLVAVAASKYIFPRVFEYCAKSQELLFISAVSVSFIFSMLFYSIGFSIAIGAFVAGVTLANLPYNLEIIGKVKSLRDFFAVIFFVSLGMELSFGILGDILIPLIIFMILAVIIKPLLIMFLCSFFGYKKRTSFKVALSLAQISEFSLIIVAQGLILGHIGQEIFSITVILAVTTIILTSYLIKFENGIYLRFSSYLDVFDKLTGPYNHLEYIPRKKHEFIICGYNRIGYSIVDKLKKMKKKMLVVDFNPEVIKRLIHDKIPCIYGDIGDIEILSRLNLRHAAMVISTAPSKRDNLLLIRTTRKENKHATIIVTSTHISKALELYDAGADYVIMPHLLGGDHMSLLLEEFSTDINKIIKHKIAHIKELHKRKSMVHWHPAHHK